MHGVVDGMDNYGSSGMTKFVCNPPLLMKGITLGIFGSGGMSLIFYGIEVLLAPGPAARSHIVGIAALGLASVSMCLLLAQRFSKCGYDTQ